MKTLLYSLTLLFTISLASCSSSDASEEIENIDFITPTLQTALEDLSSSRTTVNQSNGQTQWTATDELLVFVHENGKQPSSTADWNRCRYKFVTNSANCIHNIFRQESNPAQQLLLDPKKSYDWYVMYPYTETITSPIGDGSFEIGQQTQDCNQPMQHLGTVDIIANVKTNEKAQQNVSIALNHLGCFMKFRIKNATNADFTPQAIEFETVSATPASIAGTYRVDFKNGLTSLGNAGNNQLLLTLKNTKRIAVSSTFDVYAIMAPFSLQANDKFKVKVITDKGNSLQSSTMKNAITFKAGTINTARVNATLAEETSDVNPWENQGEIDDVIIVK